MTSPRSAVERWTTGAFPLLVAISLVWLGYEFWRLLLQPGQDSGAIDLLDRRDEVLAWFQGLPVYFDGERGYRWAVYPPASYPMLWFATGWLSEPATRWFWAGTTIAALVALCRLTARAVPAPSASGRRFLLCLPLALYATGATVGNGQLAIHVVLALVVALTALEQERSPRRDMIAGACMLAALVKPTLAAPFFWILAFRAGSIVPALGVAACYVLITLFAAWFRPEDLVGLGELWFERAHRGVVYGSSTQGYASQANWLQHIGRPDLNTQTSLALLAGLGGWVYWHRAKELWLLIGIAAIVARLWLYHAWYDDLLMLLPLIALLQMSMGEDAAPVWPAWAGPLAGAMIATLLAPGGLYLIPKPWNQLYVLLQSATWVTVFAYLVACTIASPSGVSRVQRSVDACAPRGGSLNPS